MSWWRLLQRCLPAVVLLAACHSGPPAITWGADDCDFCRMTITDQRFGAVATTATGRAVRFDAIECLAGWVAAQEKPPRALWVIDGTHPGTLLPIAEAKFYRMPSGRSPMGRGLVAASTTGDLTTLGIASGEGSFSWDEVRAMVARGDSAEASHGTTH